MILILALANVLWAAPYRQTFHVTSAVPLQLEYHSRGGFTTNDWEASLVLVTTAENVTFKLRCFENSMWKGPKPWLETSTSMAYAYRERDAAKFLENLGSAEACQARVQDVMDHPSLYELVLSNGKDLEFKKAEPPKG